MNDDFAKDVGDFQTLLELRADIRKRLEDAEEQEAERQLEQDLIDAVVERASCDIPEKMVQRQVEPSSSTWSGNCIIPDWIRNGI